MFGHFKGRVIQVMEALDKYDAVSNHLLALHRILTEKLDIQAEIYTRYCHDGYVEICQPIKEMYATEKDIIIYHYSGYASTAEEVTKSNAVKVFIYHNITPAGFFRKGTDKYDLCYQGREQLAKIIDKFDYVSGVSQFNLRELADLGAKTGEIVPIVVPEPPVPEARPKDPLQKNWLFLGRISPNKRQDKLVELFAKYINENGGEHHLTLIGLYEENDWFYKEIREIIRSNKLEDRVTLTNKIDNSEVFQHLADADIFVSVSEHEGFGVPLIEAGYYDLPVIALDFTAVPETLENSPGLARNDGELLENIHRVLTDETFRRHLINVQKEIRLKFTPAVAKNQLAKILFELLPAPAKYKSASIVICTVNRADFLERALDYCRYQTFPNFEVVVVNGPSTDRTEEVLEKYKAFIKIGRTDKHNLSISRNIGIELAAGDIVAFIDDDTIPYDDWLQTLMDAYDGVPEKVAGIGGSTIHADSFDFQCTDIAISATQEDVSLPEREQLEEGGFVRHLVGTNATFKREVLEEVKGFDEQYDYFLDESDLAFRIYKHGYTLVHQPDAFVRHEFARSENRSGKYNYNWFTITKNAAYFVLKHNDELSREENIEFLKGKIEQDRIWPLNWALEHHEITESEHLKYSEAVWKGFEQGLSDASGPAKLRKLQMSRDSVKPYQLASGYPKVGIDIKRLHICYVVLELAPFQMNGGDAYQIQNLAQEMLQLGHQVSVVMKSDEEDVYNRGRFTLYKVRDDKFFDEYRDMPVVRKNLDWSCTAARKVLDIHKEDPIDVIDGTIWDFESFALTSSKHEHKIPIVQRLVTPIVVANRANKWNMPADEIKLIWEIERDLVESADAVIPISNCVEQTFQDEYGLRPCGKWHQTYIGIRYWPVFDVHSNYEDINDRQLQNIPDDAFKVLFIGRLEPRKGIDLLVEAAVELLDDGRNYTFIIAGSDPDDWKKIALDRVKDSALRERMIFLGRVDEQMKEKLLHMADLLVFPSLYESFGIVPLEAFVHGTPVVASNSGGIPEVVEDGKSGLLFKEGDARDLKKKIEKIRKDRVLFDKLSNGAKERSKVMSSRNMAIGTMKVYKDVLVGE
jgi:glycosyltransferase involved in cell wall biosynthesis